MLLCQLFIRIVLLFFSLSYENPIIKIKGDVFLKPYSDSKFIGSIDRVKDVFGKDLLDYDNSILIKFRNENISCHCDRCFNNFWKEVKKSFDIVKENNFKDNEKDYLIKNDSTTFILECHETGPEIIFNIIENVSYILSIITNILVIYNLYQNNGSKNNNSKRTEIFIKSDNDEFHIKTDENVDVDKKVEVYIKKLFENKKLKK